MDESCHCVHVDTRCEPTRPRHNTHWKFTAHENIFELNFKISDSLGRGDGGTTVERVYLPTFYIRFDCSVA